MNCPYETRSEEELLLMNKMGKPVVLLILCLSFFGCAKVKEVVPLPVHDDVLIYDLPYDLVYLRVIEALEKTSDWDLELTEKEKGIIQVYNHAISKFGDHDKRKVAFHIERMGRNQTSVSIAPESQKVFGGDALLKSISAELADQY